MELAEEYDLNVAVVEDHLSAIAAADISEIDEISARIESEYMITPEIVYDDLVILCENMLADNLIEEVK